MRRLLFVLVASAIGFGLAQWRVPRRAVWTKIAPGVELRKFYWSSLSGAPEVVAIRTLPSHTHVATGARLAATDWRRREAAVMAVNGGFFDENGNSLGLRISGGQRVAPVRGTRWGIFYVRGGQAHILAPADFGSHTDIRDAVQCGPRLVVKGQITKLKAQWARRTGIGIQRDGRVIVAVADGEISFQDWATLWAAPTGLNCPNALNLDGGSSTQMALKTRTATLEIPGGRTVPDAVVIR